MFENMNYSHTELKSLYAKIAFAMELCDDLSDKADRNKDYLLSLELTEAEKTLGKVYDELDSILYGK